MCGIVGFLGNNRELLHVATNRLAHRGPDAAGEWTDGIVSLGHRRLSIIDVEERSNQPFHHKHLHITFNGEIYNFRQIRNELHTHTFVTESDTELILHAYEEWGEQCVERFEGMWAFAIYDTLQQKMFLSRDRFGIKPLYYSTNTEFVFASELKALTAVCPSQTISDWGVNFFFYQKYIGQHHSIYEGVYKLKPGHNLTFDIQSKALQTKAYYDLKLTAKTRIFSTEELEEKLHKAVSERLIADVEVGSFLSGGIDSSLISALVKQDKPNLKTFSMGFVDQSYNELGFSKLVAEHIHTEHITETLQIDDDFIHESLMFVDEPFGDASYIPTRLLSKITRQHVKVALSGDGADEIFGGYDIYKAHLLARYYPKMVHPILKKIVGSLPEPNRKVSTILKMKRFFRTFSSLPLERHYDWLSTFPEQERRAFLKVFVPNADFGLGLREQGDFRIIQKADLQNYMAEDILKKVDWASMSNALEVRVPFVSAKVVEAGINLEEKYKLDFGNQKKILKNVARTHIPKAILDRKKRGFTSPLKSWFRTSELLKEYTLSENYYKHSLFDQSKAAQFYKKNLGVYDYGRELWLIFVFNFWYYNHYNGAHQKS